MVRQLGAGGMGAVYLAEQKEPIARSVALRAQAVMAAINDPVAALAMIGGAWAEFSDLEQTEAGV